MSETSDNTVSTLRIVSNPWCLNIFPLRWEGFAAQTCETKSASGPAQKGAGLKSLGFADTRTLAEINRKG
jgi:hypothetical protein